LENEGENENENYMNDEQPPADLSIQNPNDAAIIEGLLNLEAVPEAVKKQFWVFLDRSHALTFYKDSDERRLMSQFEIIKGYVIASMPMNAYTPDIELEMQQVKMIFRNRIKMSIGQASGIINNNRTLINTQIQQNIAQKPAESANTGLIQRFFRR